MPIAIPPPNRPSFVLSTARSETIDSISKTEVDFSAPNAPNAAKAVEALRKRITYMGPFDQFVDWACQRHKAESLELVADKVIADLKLAWAVRTHQPEGQIRAFETARHKPHNEFASILSDQGVAILQQHSDISTTADATQFTPNTGDQENASLLSLTLSTKDAETLMKRFDPRNAREKAKAIGLQAADNTRTYVDRAGLYRTAAQLFTAAKRYTEAYGACQESANLLHQHGVQSMKGYDGLEPLDQTHAVILAADAESQAAEMMERAAALARVVDTDAKKVCDGALAQSYEIRATNHNAMAKDPATEYAKRRLIST